MTAAAARILDPGVQGTLYRWREGSPVVMAVPTSYAELDGSTDSELTQRRRYSVPPTSQSALQRPKGRSLLTLEHGAGFFGVQVQPPAVVLHCAVQLLNQIERRRKAIARGDLASVFGRNSHPSAREHFHRLGRQSVHQYIVSFAAS